MEYEKKMEDIRKKKKGGAGGAAGAAGGDGGGDDNPERGNESDNNEAPRSPGKKNLVTKETSLSQNLSGDITTNSPF